MKREEPEMSKMKSELDTSEEQVKHSQKEHDESNT